jgi:hypothetical protein
MLSRFWGARLCALDQNVTLTSTLEPLDKGVFTHGSGSAFPPDCSHAVLSSVLAVQWSYASLDEMMASALRQMSGATHVAALAGAEGWGKHRQQGSKGWADRSKRLSYPWWVVSMSVPRGWGWVKVLCRRCGKSRVVRVGIRDLNIDEALSVGRSRAEAFTQQLRDRLNKLGMRPLKTLEFLTSRGVCMSAE